MLLLIPAIGPCSKSDKVCVPMFNTVESFTILSIVLSLSPTVVGFLSSVKSLNSDLGTALNFLVISNLNHSFDSSSPSQ